MVKELWQPTAGFKEIRLRAEILAQIREFFRQRGVLEVETPLLAHGTITDANIFSLKSKLNFLPDTLYLQTSPEFCMKRLLAAGAGSIYQICKAFRDDELGCRHNPEFTILEWYREGFNHHDLMAEMDELLQLILKTPPAVRISYQQVFIEFVKFDPFTIELHSLKKQAIAQGINIDEGFSDDKDDWLHLIMSHCIELHLGHENPMFVYDYPPSQAALAQVRHDAVPKVAERFEVYIKGVELANGFHELSDSKEQRRRFLSDLARRRELGREAITLDENFLAALEHGFPDCSGVALGIDRLLMLAAGVSSIEQVITFPINRA